MSRSTATQNDADGHETDMGVLPVPSIFTGALHELPLNVNALPSVSTATQNDADAHDTALSPYAAPSIFIGALHELPLYVNASPCPSTAAQNNADAHDTSTGCEVPGVTGGSTETGADHPLAASAVAGASSEPAIIQARAIDREQRHSIPVCACAPPARSTSTGSPLLDAERR